MSGFAEFGSHDGLGLAELVRTKRVHPCELVEEAITRIESLNPRLNAVICNMFDRARTLAATDLPDGPFRGVPFLLKDLTATCAGVPTSCGGRLLKDLPMPHDSEIVCRIQATGAIVVGKTNTPEFGLVPVTEPEAFGPARNPWNLERTPGGSSGGSAAAVAARIVPLAHGGDGGGSLRIPASCCGLFGLKPTRGRTPTGPDRGELWHGFVQEHVVSRSVRDSAAMLDAISRLEVGAPYFTAPHPRPFLQEVATSPGRLRIAFTSTPFLGRRVHEDCKRGLEATVRVLGELGHEPVEGEPRIDRDAFSLAFLTIVAAETSAEIEWAAGQVGRKVGPADFEPGTYALGLLGNTLTAARYVEAVRYLQTAARDVGRFFETCDVLLTPTLSEPPPVIGALRSPAGERAFLKLVGRLRAGWLLKAMGVLDALAAKAFDFIPYTPVFNVTGQPAMSVPLHWNDAGLPIGMHFVGRFGDEATLFRLAGQLERARPWADRVPPIVHELRSLYAAEAHCRSCVSDHSVSNRCD